MWRIRVMGDLYMEIYASCQKNMTRQLAALHFVAGNLFSFPEARDFFGRSGPIGCRKPSLHGRRLHAASLRVGRTPHLRAGTVPLLQVLVPTGTGTVPPNLAQPSPNHLILTR